MKHTIFYSWQSDLPNNTNRGFIESVIEKAIKDLNGTELYDLEPSIDRDTKGIPGAPNITQAIIDKIKTCDAFVADISIVTGIKDDEERPSPNPNVLLELGYAISLLGWDKIVLFCNEVYGTNEDLPFDIRQHRRIGYRLQQEDPKAGSRNDLAKHFKDRLIELLQKGKSNLSVKQPSLDVSWNFIDIKADGVLEAGTDSKQVDLPRSVDFSETLEKVKQEIELVQDKDGSIAPKWSDKKDSYIRRGNEFIEQLNDRGKWLNYLINNSVKKIVPITLSVDNNGNASASDIRVVFPLPEWLYAFKKYPSKRDIPDKPNMPTPKRPRATDAFATRDMLGNIGNMISGIDHSLLTANTNRTSACYPRENEIYFWADRLLHKHVITNGGDRFYLLALPEAPLGEYVLKGKAFCSEYDDWKEIELLINVV